MSTIFSYILVEYLLILLDVVLCNVHIPTFLYKNLIMVIIIIIHNINNTE